MAVTWEQEALQIIHQHFTELRATEPATVSNGQIMKRISRTCYPWGQKSGWPYKAWLLGIRDYRRTVAPIFTESVKGPLFGD